MSTEICNTGRLVSSATSMGATAGVVQAPPGAHTVFFSTSSACGVGMCPKIDRVVTLIGTTYTDVKTSLIDADSSTTVSFNSFATTSKIYLGCRRKFRGIHIDVTNTNSNASVMTVKYITSEATFAAVAGFSDGTALAGATLGQDGLVTWTVPTDWVPAKAHATQAELDEPLYWIEITVSLALDATVSIAAITSLQQDAAVDGSFGSTTEVYIFKLNDVGGIEHIDAGAGTLALNWVVA